LPLPKSVSHKTSYTLGLILTCCQLLITGNRPSPSQSVAAGLKPSTSASVSSTMNVRMATKNVLGGNLVFVSSPWKWLDVGQTLLNERTAILHGEGKFAEALSAFRTLGAFLCLPGFKAILPCLMTHVALAEYTSASYARLSFVSCRFYPDSWDTALSIQRLTREIYQQSIKSSEEVKDEKRQQKTIRFSSARLELPRLVCRWNYCAENPTYNRRFLVDWPPTNAIQRSVQRCVNPIYGSDLEMPRRQIVKELH